MTKSLRVSGGDYSTYEEMVTGLNALFPLTEDVVVNVQGGQAFGRDGILNSIITVPGSPNPIGNYNIIIQTEPTETATPARILGRIGIDDTWEAVTGYLIVKNIIQYVDFTGHYFTGAVFSGNGTSQPTYSFGIKVENCVIAVRLDTDYSGGILFTVAGAAPAGYINNCTLAITNIITPWGGGLADVTAHAGPILFTNNIFLTHGGANAARVGFEYSGAAFKNNTAYNYGGGVITFIGWSGDETFPNAVLNTNPRLETSAYIQASNDAPGTIIARSAKLTSLSSACIGNADPATATSTDINGKTRA